MVRSFSVVVGLPGDVTRILNDLSGDDRAAVEAVLPLLYNDLRRLADSFFRRERSDHTLQATALVHEAYLRLFQGNRDGWKSREHFFRSAATIMRHILISHARARGRQKRGGGIEHTPLDDTVAIFEERAIDLLALDEALDRLAAMDPRQHQIVELRFFAGLSVRETADVLGVSERTVENEWLTARVWLLRAVNSA